MAKITVAATRYAVNLGDLGQMSEIIRGILIVPNMPHQEVVDCEPGRLDGAAVVLECDEAKAKAVIDVIRIKFPKYVVRCYEVRGKQAKRI